MADDKKKHDDDKKHEKKHAHGEGPVTDAKAHAETKAKPEGQRKKGGRKEKSKWASYWNQSAHATPCRRLFRRFPSSRSTPAGCTLGGA